GPVEGLHQRLRQREAGGLDDDVLGRIGSVQQRRERRQEIVGDRAADAAIGELEDATLVALFEAAAADELAIDAEIAELVDDESEPPRSGLRDQAADQAGLAGTEEAGDDG